MTTISSKMSSVGSHVGFVVGSWDESEFEDSVRNLSLFDSSDSNSDFSDVEDSKVPVPARTSSSKSVPATSFKSSKSPSISEPSPDRYESFSDMQRDLTGRQIYEEFRSMSRQTYSQDLFGSSPPRSITSPR